MSGTDSSKFKPDAIYCHPIHLDYPLWRKLIHDDRNRFNKVIVSFTQMNAGGDYREFVKEQMSPDATTFVDNPPFPAEGDWRDKATNNALNHSVSDWVFFSEQDFFIDKPGEFWSMVEKRVEEGFEVIVYNQDGRLHPCCLFVKRGVLNKTRLDFGVIPDVADHFARIAEDLVTAKAKIAHLQKTDCFHHLNGLSQNMFMLQSGETPNYREEDFKDYCERCLESGIELHPDFEMLFRGYLYGGAAG